MNKENDSIYLVASYTDTVPGKMIKLRANMKFWNRYQGDAYSHISLSKDSILGNGNMMSFARKEMHNPFNSGLVQEDIRAGMFSLKANVSKIAVMKLKVSETEYKNIVDTMDQYWENKDIYGFNFPGLASMLFCGRGVAPKNKYFCSQWTADVLKQNGVDLFSGKKPHDIRPFDFYGELKNDIVYEGLTVDYPEYNLQNEEKVIELTEQEMILRKQYRQNQRQQTSSNSVPLNHRV